MLDRVLIVESHFHTRLQLVEDFARLNLADDVVGASSVRDAIDELHRRPLGACVLGPKLQPSTALALLEESRSIPLQDSCAFLLVRGEKASESQQLEGLTDGVLQYPYTRDALRTGVQNAVSRLMDVVSQRKSTRSFPTGQTELTRTQAFSRDLRDIAEQISQRTLTVQSDGTPAATTDYAIRKAIESFIVEPGGMLSYADEQFVSLVTTWFHKRVRGEHQPTNQALHALIQKNPALFD
ncbi:MAG: hypothetical protein IT290_06075 [Deltaproteobacteria bacterium]|nr:hypothetical protein [Deltaproteobacteria bacterium]